MFCDNFKLNISNNFIQSNKFKEFHKFLQENPQNKPKIKLIYRVMQIENK